jgi:uncharacterized glyoxalase superfamily protein PhnB
MTQSIATVTFLVRDYDEALAYFTHCLQFTIIEDTLLSEHKRWVRVAPPNSHGVTLLLARAVTEEQITAMGKQAGGRVFLFLHTDDFWRDYEEMRRRGVAFVEAPREEAYGAVAVFCDLYGNRWDLLQLRNRG